jgi:ABC-type xylose transport system permease subunit
LSTSSSTELAQFHSLKLEDWILFLTPIIVGLAGSGLAQNLIPGVPGLLVGVVIGVLAKTLIGIGQNFKANYEDVLSFIITFIGLLGSALSGYPQFIVYGTVLGLIAKALPSLSNGLNPEDLLLTLGAIIAGIGASFGLHNLESVGLLLSVLGKSLPSLGSSAGIAQSVPATK